MMSDDLIVHERPVMPWDFSPRCYECGRFVSHDQEPKWATLSGGPQYICKRCEE